MSYVGDWLGRGAEYWPGNLAVVDVARDARYTYAELNDRANRLANVLRDRAGIGRGDRVGMLALNGVEVLDAFFACGKLGAVFTPYNWRLHPAELNDLLDLTTPGAFLFSADFAANVAAIMPEASSVRAWLQLEDAPIPGALPYRDLLRDTPATPVQDDGLDAEDIVALLFTGGTTGRAKAARVSYRMIAWNTLNTVIHELDRDDVTITHTPMFHTGGLLVYTIPLLTLGGTVVVMRTWDADLMLELIERERVTMFFCVPTQYQMLLAADRFESTDFSSVRFLTSGGAPLPVELIEQWTAVHDIPFKQGFGMTEFGPGIFSMGPEFAVSKAGSIGRPNFHVAARIVADDGNHVPSDTVGELVLKGPSMCSGYFDDPEASAASVDDDGWFHTGDLARCDADGFYFIVDRKKDMFISGGENIYPTEIEAVLYGHPAVFQCAVIGVPDPEWGEVGKACIVPQPGSEPTESEILDYLRAHLARYKIPKSVEFLDTLPISPQGKILKRELRGRFIG
jgi:fatty-acyl-CoA synthase